MAKKGHIAEQILRALHQAESGTRVADICREHGISEATFYNLSNLGLLFPDVQGWPSTCLVKRPLWKSKCYRRLTSIPITYACLRNRENCG